MKRVVFVIVFAVCYFVSFSVVGNSVLWKKGNGTKQNPFLIESAENLYFLAIQVNKGNDYENIYFCLSNDIDLKGNNANQWQPIGTYTNPFRGNFNGNNFEIKNLYIKNQALDYAGLFGCSHGGNIENIGISNFSYVAGKDYVGGIVAHKMGGNISNCYNKAFVSGKDYVGGITGYQYNTTIQSCYNTGIISGNSYVGGIIGMGYAKTNIYDCYNVGKVVGEYHLGGIVGKIDGYNSKSILKNCYQASVLNSMELIGTGIAVELSNCYFTDVIGMENEKFGSILTVEQMKSDSFLTKLNVLENKWIQDKEPYVNSGYPILASMKYRGIFTHEATNVTQKTAMLQGNFISENEKILQKGFEYKTADTSHFTVIFIDDAIFSYNLTDLKPNTRYEYRVFVVTNEKKIIGQNIEFQTLAEKCSDDCKHNHKHIH